MKKIVLAYVVFLNLLMVERSFSQMEVGRSIITIGVGKSFITSNIMFEAKEMADQIHQYVNPNIDAPSSYTPAMFGSYEYKSDSMKHFSIGVAVAYQRWNITTFSFIDPSQPFTNLNNLVVNPLSISRTSFAIRPLYHFSKSKCFDPYMGLSVGYNIWVNPIPIYFYDFSISDLNPESYSPKDTPESGFTIGMLFGLRGYITKNIGMNVELSFCAPYTVAFGFNYRF